MINANFVQVRNKGDRLPVNGGWSAWGDWSSCSNNQDGKSECKKTKHRYCNNPPVSNDGQECVGETKEEEDCTESDLSNPADNPRCMRHGVWTPWSQYSRCNINCEKTRTRTCTNPAPFNDEDKCPEEASETR